MSTYYATKSMFTRRMERFRFSLDVSILFSDVEWSLVVNLPSRTDTRSDPTYSGTGGFGVNLTYQR